MRILLYRSDKAKVQLEPDASGCWSIHVGRIIFAKKDTKYKKKGEQSINWSRHYYGDIKQAIVFAHGEIIRLSGESQDDIKGLIELIESTRDSLISAIVEGGL